MQFLQLFSVIVSSCISRVSSLMTVLQPAIVLASSSSSSSKLTQDHLRAAKLCRDVYSESVESSPDTYVESADTSAQATVTLEGTKATVCFRGSDSAADWKTNFSLAKVPFLSRKHTNPEVEVHSGFFMAHNSVKAKIYAKLNKMLESGECTSILFAGHSSGVMSAISAFDFQNDRNVPVEVVTFGAPKVGNAAFASDFDRAITCTRIVNDNDGVALAPMFGGYHHVGSNVIHMADPGGDGGVAQLFSKLWSMVRLDAVSDHNIDKYVTNIERCLKKVN